eukprot:CAMPEP_0173198072 /NCGR_PEP_ID=MMETSP1141-20130122/16496_1 /TAXON_ID=483371 /ORGANISM="non described non described, Strain CCMP2298" /LENGTH=324 /DNA_ID=CAMNT_0014122849 /DNA_START=98 /DNA_END=1068 /DNA_ORIENTATION=-
MADFNSMLKGYKSETANAKKRKVEDKTVQKVRSASRNVPNFLILGAQKAGTMAAVKNLNKHPDISVLSEVHYFDRMWHSKDPSWYTSQFTSSKPIKGEKTPELIYVDECFERMKQVCPDARFLLFLRDPVARAYSAWNMNASKNREAAAFDECVRRNLENLDEFRSYGTGEFHYVQRGFYMDQIERFRKVFPDAPLHIVIAERVRADPVAEYEKIFAFLGARPLQIEAEDDHVGSYGAGIGVRVGDRLRKVYNPHNERLFAWLGYRIPEWDADYAPAPKPTPAPAPAPSTTAGTATTATGSASTTGAGPAGPASAAPSAPSAPT